MFVDYKSNKAAIRKYFLNKVTVTNGAVRPTDINGETMANNIPLDTARSSLIVRALWLLATLSYSQACPDTCFCIDAFVTCSDFRVLDMHLLPPQTDTLVLTGGKMEEIPPGFLANATNLRMLEINSVNAKVIRSKAFADLSNLDLFSITSSAFDLVEPDSFSGLTDISKFHISDSKFGRVDRHAFSNINNIVDLRMWSSSFNIISDEAFYKLTDTISFQLYQNNITSLGKELFLGASGVDDITFYKNVIERVSEKCFDSVADATSRMVLHANLFMCTCDIAWMLGSPFFKEYLASNECIFPDRAQDELQKFRIADLTRKDLCPLFVEESTESSTESTTTMSSSTVALPRSTRGMVKSTVTLPLSSTQATSTTMSASQKQENAFSASSKELTSHMSSSTLAHTAASLEPVTSAATSKSSSVRSPVDVSTSSQDETKYVPMTTGSTRTSVTDGHVNEGRPEASVDIEGDKDAQIDGSSAAGKTTFPDNASFRSLGNWIFTTLLVCLCIFLRTYL